MGPRPFSRGNPTSLRTTRCRKHRFNGAATFQSRKLTLARAGERVIGDASMGPRPFSRGNPHTANDGRPLHSWLQWGRDLSVAETSAGQNSPWPDRSLQWGRDLSVAETRHAARQFMPKIRFNGAATFQSRKRPVVLQQARLLCASMGPRPFSRGNPKQDERLHDLLDASMGPRPFSRGNPAQAREDAAHLAAASMGPRPFSRGNRSSGLARLTTSTLQWGRDLSVAET